MKIPRQVIENLKKIPTKDKIKAGGALGTLGLTVEEATRGYIKGRKSYDKSKHLKNINESLEDAKTDLKEGNYQEPWEKEEIEYEISRLKRQKKKIEDTPEKELKHELGKDKASSGITRGLVLGGLGTGAALYAHKHPISAAGAVIGATALGTKGYISTKKEVEKRGKEEGADPEKISKVSKGMGKIAAGGGAIIGGLGGALAGGIVSKGLKIAKKIKK